MSPGAFASHTRDGAPNERAAEAMRTERMSKSFEVAGGFKCKQAVRRCNGDRCMGESTTAGRVWSPSAALRQNENAFGFCPFVGRGPKRESVLLRLSEGAQRAVPDGGRGAGVGRGQEQGPQAKHEAAAEGSLDLHQQVSEDPDLLRWADGDQTRVPLSIPKFAQSMCLIERFANPLLHDRSLVFVAALLPFYSGRIQSFGGSVKRI